MKNPKIQWILDSGEQYKTDVGPVGLLSKRDPPPGQCPCKGNYEWDEEHESCAAPGSGKCRKGWYPAPHVYGYGCLDVEQPHGLHARGRLQPAHDKNAAPRGCYLSDCTVFPRSLLGSPL